MIISSCPQCGDTYRITDLDLSETTLVQCPWCGDQFSMQEVVAGLPPELIMVDADHDQQPLIEPSFDTAQEINFSGLGDQIGLNPVDISLGVPSQQPLPNEIPEDEAPLGLKSWDSGDNIGSNPIEFPKGRESSRRQSSGLGTLVGIILGGLVSLPLAGLILLALGKAPNLGFWPFNGGQPTQRSAAPLPPSGSEELRRGTPLRFNQSINDVDQSEDDPSKNALEQILIDSSENSEAVTELPEDKLEPNDNGDTEKTSSGEDNDS